MGQVFGRAPIQAEALPFINLPRRNIHDLWEAFNDIAEGFGLTLSEFQEILRVSVKEYKEFSDKRMDAATEALFHVYDDDRNSLVDSLEFLSATAIVSAMSVEEKLWFIFGIYDFDESGLLTVDEMTLSLRAAISGLCKISGVEKPKQSEIDLIANCAFEISGGLREVSIQGGFDGKEKTAITKDEFVLYVINNPELISWIEYFGDFEEVEPSSYPTYIPKMHVHRDLPHQHIIDEHSSSSFYRKNEKLYREPQPWNHVAPLSEPSQTKDINPNSMPCTSLTLDWIYGRNTDSKAFYTHDGAIIYPSGATTVKSTVSDGAFQQFFFMGQSDYITSLAIWHQGEDDSLIATSQFGEKPTINIWSSSRMENIVAVFGFHKVGVSKLDFSPSGDLLVSVGMDPMNSIAVYKWREKRIIFTSPSTSQICMDCRFLGTNTQFGICGDKFVHFWSCSTRSNLYCRQRGIFGKKISRQLMTCITHVGSLAITGATTGELCVWEGRTCIRTIIGHHSGTITTIQSVKTTDNLIGGICVGTSDGRVHLWNESLELISTFHTNSYGGLKRGVNSVCWNRVAKKVLIGLEGNDLIEISDVDGSIIGTVVNGHFGSNILGISNNPVNTANIVTIGDDNTVRLWDTKNHSMVKMVVLDTCPTCVSYNHNGSLIAVGLGGFTKIEKKGAFSILRETDLNILHEARDSSFSLTACKFSKNGNIFAFGSENGYIYIYNASDYELIGKTKGHKGGITNLDLGHDSKHPSDIYLRSNSTSGELCYWNIKGEEQTAKSQKDVHWETQTCTFSWAVKEAHSVYNDGVNLNACACSNSGEQVACVDNIGRIRIYNYPINSMAQKFLTFRGHSALIQNVVFTADDEYLLTVGGDELSVFQWRHITDTINLFHDPKRNGLDLIDGEILENSETWEKITNDDMDFMFEMEENRADKSFAPRKPWRRTICAPTEEPSTSYSEPDNDFMLEWIHGYSAGKCRNNLMYGSKGETIYNVGKTVVVYDTKQKKQKFYRCPKDEITCISLNPQKSLCAVGQIGTFPSIHIFNYETQETYRVIKGHHQRAISAIKFDPSGRYLVSCGQDDNHTLIVYDFESDKVISSTPTCGNKTLDLEYQKDGGGLIQCGDNFLRFWTLDNGNNLNFKNAFFGDEGKIQTFYSIGHIGSFPLIGTEDGHLYRFLGRKLEHAFKAHESSIYTIHSTNEGIITGSKDGFVKIWGQSLNCKLAINMMEVECRKHEVKSVCWSNEFEKILVGTLSNEIWEFSAIDGSNLHGSNGPIQQSHFDANTSGLAVSPVAPRFITTSDDKTLRMWDLYENKLMNSTEIEMKSRACCYSPDGSMIALGFGSPKREATKTYDGKWIIMNENDLNILYETRDSKKYITEIKWSQNGENIAVGSWDSKIYVYDVDSEVRTNIKLSLSSVIDQHNSFISHFDFSEDSQYLQSNCGASELFFFEVDTGLYIPGASRLKDTKWETQTCIFGWHVQGVWPSQNDGTEIISIDCNLNSKISNPTIAVGDNYGNLKLFCYPCVSPDTNFKRYKAHLGPISKVRWISGGSHLVTIGERDQSIMIWKNQVDENNQIKNTTMVQLERDADIDTDDLKMLIKSFEYDLTSTDRLVDSSDNVSRPWVASMVEPSECPVSDPELPGKKLELTHALGFQSQFVGNGLLYNLQSNIVFSTSNICVVQHRFDNTQTFFRGHNYQISCIVSSPSRRFIASGDFAPRPTIKIWDGQNCEEINVLKEFHRKGIMSMSFSSDSMNLVSIGAENEHMICIWKTLNGEWNDAILCAWATSGKEKVLFTSFMSQKDTGFLLASGGTNEIKFWNLHQTDLISSKGVFGSIGKSQPMLCGAGIEQYLVTGSPSGHLYIWKGKQLEKLVKAHEQSIHTVHICDARNIVTGCANGCISTWSLKFEQLRSFSLSDANVESMNMSVRSIDTWMNSSQTRIMKILVGTMGSEIYEISMDTGDMILLHEGHFEGECWGLAMHPKDPDIFATCGDDHTLRIWSVSLRRVLRKVKTVCPARSIAWSYDGKDILVGCGAGDRSINGRKDGAFIIIDVATMQIKAEGRNSKQWITDVKYSPDSKTFALSSIDENIYIYENSKKKQYSLRTLIDKHNAVVKALDYSLDSSVIRSESADGEQFFHKTSNGEHIAYPSQVKEVDWASTTCTYGWSVQGLWPSISDPHQNMIGKPVCVHNTTKVNNLLAMGDDCGSVKLYNHPVISKRALCHSTKIHTNHVAKCRFSCDDSTLVTIGKSDRSVLIWNVIPRENAKLDAKRRSDTGNQI